MLKELARVLMTPKIACESVAWAEPAVRILLAWARVALTEMASVISMRFFSIIYNQFN